MTIFDKLITETGKENEIDEHIAGLDKIKDNIKSEKLDIKDYIIPQPGNSVSGFTAAQRRSHSGGTERTSSGNC